MKSSSLLFLAFILFYFQSQAQRAHLDLSTQRSLKFASPEKKSQQLFVKGDLKKIEAVVKDLGGIYKYGYKNICAIEIPLNQLDRFLLSDAIQGIENAEIPVVSMLDTSVVNACVLPVHQGIAPLPGAYTGNGVVVGIIDDGIDWRHEDFKKPNGDTRIRYIWDQKVPFVSSMAIAPYGFGREWTEVDINNNLCTHTETVGSISGPAGTHGTNVSGIAAGNGRAVGNYTGMAPNSEIVVVALMTGSNFLSNIVNGADYIFKKADAMGKSCVINISYGTYIGSHDGRDFASLLIDAMLEERDGRVVVAAAGNAGSPPWNLVNWHLGYDVTADTAFTWFTTGSAGDVYFPVWADTADFNDVNFAISVYNPSTNTVLARTNFLNVKTDYGISPSNTFDTLDIIMQNGGTFYGLLKTEVELSEGRYRLDIWVPQPQSNTYYWAFETFGSGRFDVWSISSTSYNMDFSYMVENVPHDSVYPPILNYRFPDNDKTLTSSFQNSDKVITVGNYVQRTYYYDMDSNIQIIPEIINGELLGDVAATSSHGPTRDNRIKPDISAPGSVTLTTGNANIIGGFQSSRKAPGGKHSRNGATSMASPVVAGVVALYLEKNPTANWREVKAAITGSAKTDILTGAVPNNLFGWGKVCAFEALQLNFVSGCTDSTAFNYNPLANLEDGSCIPIVFGCMDSTALNYNALANVEDSTCVYDTTTVGGIIAERNVLVKFYPNPFGSETRLIYKIQPEMAGKTSVNIFNTLGQKADEILLEHEEGILIYSPKDFSKGVYFYSVTYKGASITNSKLVIY